ncbi:penicillin-binding transpeptidase domain-containing protein [Jannaschia sp. R86511]|uniref:penicillin-binding transpeptidase domain-containing protein n=1 Tax=Jannaschia sp. R86511 TaxID=3093853 RepID=UPI0036D2D1B7
MGSRGWVWWVVGVVVILAGGAVAAYAVAVVPGQREDNRDAAARQALGGLARAWQGQDLAGLGDEVDYTALTTGLTEVVGSQDEAARAGGASEPTGEASASAGPGESGGSEDEVEAPAEDSDEPRPVWPTSVEVVEVVRTDDTATATLTVTWPFGWAYDTTVEARQMGNTDAGSVRGAFDTSGGQWATTFTAAQVAPGLTDDAVLAAERETAERGTVLGRDGEPLVEERAVVDIGIQPSRVADLGDLTATLADVLGVDGAGLAERVQAAGEDEFVPVITLRREAYDRVRDDVRTQEGVVFQEGTLPLAPTTEFARATLGRSGQATAEIVEASEGRVLPGDVVGLSGLQRRYDEHLAGQAGFTVVAVVGEQTTGLFTAEPTAGADLALTLDEDVQVAADQALSSVSDGNGNAALVALDVPSGDVLAVANTPATGTDRALTGTYPPGSTFKSVSTLALLGTGLTPDEVVPCPQTATVQGRAFGNVEDSQLGDVPFSTDFARSCNTAFVGLSDRLQPGDLGAAAATVGLGGEWSVGTPVATGDVPDEESAVDLAAASIGQGRVLASPMAMAQVAASFADGTWTAPRLVLEPAPQPAAEPPALDAERAATVRELMRAVVTDGTASALADVPGDPVHAKTGTAEYGTEVPPGTHAWVIGFQGDVAFAVLVEDGGSGSRVAVPVAETFLRLLQ